MLRNRALVKPSCAYAYFVNKVSSGQIGLKLLQVLICKASDVRTHGGVIYDSTNCFRKLNIEWALSLFLSKKTTLSV